MNLHHIAALPLHYSKPLDEQFLHLQIHPACMVGSATMMPYPPVTPMINAHPSVGSFNHLPSSSPLPAYAMAPGPAFYQPSPPFTGTMPHPLATPYHPLNPALMLGAPPHAPVPSQRTVHFTTGVPPGHPFSAPPRHLSPKSMQNQEMYLHIVEHPTPLSINRIPPNEYTQSVLTAREEIPHLSLCSSRYDIYRSTPNNGHMVPMSIPVQSNHYPSMVAEYSQSPRCPW